MVHPSATMLRDTLLPMPPVAMAVEEGGRADGLGCWRVLTAGTDHELETSEDGVEWNCVCVWCVWGGGGGEIISH